MKADCIKQDDCDVPNLHCGNCKHYKQCKRVDDVTIKFAFLWFKSYDHNQFNGVICRDFEPQGSWIQWTSFDDYFPKFVEQWLPYGNTNTLIYFIINDDRTIRYGVNMMDFINGTMIENGRLKAVEKMYYKRCKDGFGYRLIREEIEGVKLTDGRNENA